tara:strand:+ start:441 stop:614 length:174 start_codon:yes stop_codon:yes gene_type:complete
MIKYLTVLLIIGPEGDYMNKVNILDIFFWIDDIAIICFGFFWGVHVFINGSSSYLLN